MSAWDKFYWFCFGSNVMWLMSALQHGDKSRGEIVFMSACVGLTVFCEVMQWAAEKYLARRA
jgi:hypothetical protein